MIKMQWLPEGRLQEPSISIMRFNREKIMLQSPSLTLYLCACFLRQASRGQTKWPQTNAIPSAPQWLARLKLCVCVFLVTLVGARSKVVPCRFGVCSLPQASRGQTLCTRPSKRDPLCATMVGSVKVVCVCFW